MRLVLASGSPRRRELLSRICGDFTVFPASGVSEFDSGLPLAELPLVNALMKARAVSESFPDCLVLGADTIVELDGEIKGKPSGIEGAKKMLLELSGKTHNVISAVCLVNPSGSIECVFSETSAVTFKKLDKRIVSEYMEKVYTLDKAGAYAVQEYGDMIIEKFDGNIDNIIGLPLKKTAEALTACGFLE